MGNFHKLQSLPRHLGKIFLPLSFINFIFWDYLEQYDYLKILIGCFWRKKHKGGGLLLFDHFRFLSYNSCPGAIEDFLTPSLKKFEFWTILNNMDISKDLLD